MNLVKLFISLAVIFVLLILTSYKYSEFKEIGFNNSKILSDAKSIFDKNLTFREWVAMHGGVYVPITEKTPPNPYLADIKNRDITTTTGKKLTLMNSSYALREFMNEFKSSYGEKGKITSLKFLNLDNAPDKFEYETLKLFKKNSSIKEVSKKIQNSNGEMELRYIKSLEIEKSCLKCHINKGYKVREKMGAISITLPLKRYEKSLSNDLEYLQKIHLIALIIGLSFLYITCFYLRKSREKEKKLNEHIEEVYNIFNRGNVILFRWNNDEEWSIDYVSNNVDKVFGYSVADFMSGRIKYASLIDRRDITMVKNDVKLAIENGSKNFEHHPYRIRVKNGDTIWVNDSSQVIRDENQNVMFFVGYIQDITKQQNQEKILKQKVQQALIENTKQLQTLQQQTKMASMGEMIGAIAHQWRQPLNELGISIQNLKYDYKAGVIDEEFINNYISSNKKIIMFMSKTIDDFRSFFRVDKQKIDFKIKKTVESVISMLSGQLNNRKINVSIDGDEFVYNGFQSEFQQVILNLINNSTDAFKENEIKDSTIKITLEKNIIKIQDNAGGIDEDVIKRVFEPYFTTKEQGKGTGMGLYMSKMIIEDNMNGILSVKNIDDGVCFIIELG